MRFLEVPAAMTLTFGEKPDGTPELVKPYSFTDYLLDAVRHPQSGFGAWDKQDIGIDILRNLKECKRTSAHEIALEDAHYEALVDAVRRYPWAADVAFQTIEAGFRKALENPKKGKAG